MSTNSGRKTPLPGIRKEVLFGLFLFIATLVVYHPVTSFDFVVYDDPMYVAENEAVRAGLSWDTVVWSFTEGTRVTNYWAPLTWLSMALDYQLYGMNAGGYHLTNLVLHLAGSLLLFVVFLKMTGGFWQSAVVAALFALHPLHVESVAWITERKDVLSTFFWFLTMAVYIPYVKNPKPVWYLALLTVFTLGLMAKPMLITLPFVFLLLDYWPLGRLAFFRPSENVFPLSRDRQASALYLVAEKIPFFVIAGIFSIITYVFQAEGNALPSFEKIPVAVRLENVFVSYVHYLWQLFWPFDLAVIYPYPRETSTLYAVSAALFLAVVTLFAFRYMRRLPYVIVGWLWYLGTLVPVSGIVVIGSHVRADRYTYVPYVGLFVVIAWGLSSLLKKVPRYRYLPIFFAVCFLSLLMIVSRIQVGYWKNSITLFEHCLAVTTANYVAENNLGLALKENGLTTRAMEHYARALDINPGFEMGHLNMGVALAELGRIKEAETHYLLALRIKPDWAVPYCNLGNIRFRSGRIDEAITFYGRALDIDPDYIDALNGLGGAWVRKGRLDKAEAFFRRALAIKPDSAVVRGNLKQILDYKQKQEDPN